MDSTESLDLLLEDKEIKLDTPHIESSIRCGEIIISTIEDIEDHKGNREVIGRLFITNLRLIWTAVARKKCNLRIGFGRICKIEIKLMGKKIGGSDVALYVLAAGGKNRLEFLFTDISKQMERHLAPLFQQALNIYHLYQRTYLYRDLRLRGAILLSGQLMMLPREQIINQIFGVSNLSSDQGNLGSFIITNIRLVWYADANETFNISLPYIQIENIRICDSKYGLALVITTAITGGSYILGFRIDPIERLQNTHKELKTLHQIYTENPDFGISADDLTTNCVQGGEIKKPQATNDIKIEDYQEIDEQQEKEVHSKLNSYLAAGCLSASNKSARRQPVYCKELGFAIERILDGYKLKDLWNVLPQNILVIEEEND